MSMEKANPTKIKEEVLALMADSRKWKAQREYSGITKEHFEETMKNTFNYLYTNSSTLFDRCIAGDLNIEQFNYMIAMLEKVNAGKDFQDASKEVGQKLVDIYVKPILKDK